MGLIDAVRAWLFGADDDADDGGESDDQTTPSGGDGDDESASEPDEPDGLDPAGATETRTATATDDAVDALRDVRQSQAADESQPADESRESGDDHATTPEDGTNR